MKLEEICDKWEGIKSNHYGEQSRLADMSHDHMDALLAIAVAVKRLPWGNSIALPWCIESFPRLVRAFEELES